MKTYEIDYFNEEIRYNFEINERTLDEIVDMVMTCCRDIEGSRK